MKTYIYFFSFIIFYSCVSFSQTTVPPGNVSGTWNLSGSPYNVTGDITIPSGSTLTVEPGVSIKFQGNYYFTISGRISAIGTITNQIVFTSQDTSIGWHGLRFSNIDGNGMDSSRLTYCRFTSGKAIGATLVERRGGAVYAVGSSKIIFRNCTFENNYAEYDGGAVCLLSNSNADFQDCLFNMNMSGFYGAALYVDASHPKIKNCTLSNGYASFFGGGLAAWNGSMLKLENCKILNNTAGAVCGIYTAVNSSPVLKNCLFSGNVSNLGSGGAMGFSVSTATIINCTLTANSAAQGGAGIWFYNSSGSVKNSIVWNNSPDAISVVSSNVTVDHSDITNGFTGTGNINLNPQFLGSGEHPFSIQETSPCRNSGTTDTAGLALPFYDLANNPRICEGTIDMGAYEFYVPIPVELSSFNSIVKGNSVTLQWTTASEKNNYGFAVEKNNGKEWTESGFVRGMGTSVEICNYSFTENNLQSGKYFYRLKQVDLDGSYKYYMLPDEVEVVSPQEFWLSQNYPNPFNPETKIKYSVPQTSQVVLKVFDVLGHEIETLVNDQKSAGTYELTWNAANLPSGVYFYQLKAGDFTETKEMILMK